MTMDKLHALNKQDWRVHYLKCRWQSTSCPQIVLVPKTTGAQCPTMWGGGGKYVKVDLSLSNEGIFALHLSPLSFLLPRSSMSLLLCEVTPCLLPQQY